MADPVERRANIDAKTVEAFGDEWSRFDQARLEAAELHRHFDRYFAIFPWEALPEGAQGFDMGCGSGRWARLVAPRVGLLHCIDPSATALGAARRMLAGATNVAFHEAGVDAAPLAPASQDFGYSLGVLHHVPDTAAALAACARLLKPGAPFLLYLYYRFDNRPDWFRALWQGSELFRAAISRLPAGPRALATDLIALLVYWPLARFSALVERAGGNPAPLPLSYYRNASLFTMRTDSRDRFGTPLEQRFTRAEIEAMMADAGLGDIRFSEREPYWVALGFRR
jgi:SAM-dependent methyltransferase